MPSILGQNLSGIWKWGIVEESRYCRDSRAELVGYSGNGGGCGGGGRGAAEEKEWKRKKSRKEMR